MSDAVDCTTGFGPWYMVANASEDTSGAIHGVDAPTFLKLMALLHFADTGSVWLSTVSTKSCVFNTKHVRLMIEGPSTRMWYRGRTSYLRTWYRETLTKWLIRRMAKGGPLEHGDWSWLSGQVPDMEDRYDAWVALGCPKIDPKIVANNPMFTVVSNKTPTLTLPGATDQHQAAKIAKFAMNYGMGSPKFMHYAKGGLLLEQALVEAHGKLSASLFEQPLKPTSFVHDSVVPTEPLTFENTSDGGWSPVPVNQDICKFCGKPATGAFCSDLDCKMYQGSDPVPECSDCFGGLIQNADANWVCPTCDNPCPDCGTPLQDEHGLHCQSKACLAKSEPEPTESEVEEGVKAVPVCPTCDQKMIALYEPEGGFACLDMRCAAKQHDMSLDVDPHESHDPDLLCPHCGSTASYAIDEHGVGACVGCEYSHGPNCSECGYEKSFVSVADQWVCLHPHKKALVAALDEVVGICQCGAVIKSSYLDTPVGTATLITCTEPGCGKTVPCWCQDDVHHCPECKSKSVVQVADDNDAGLEYVCLTPQCSFEA